MVDVKRQHQGCPVIGALGTGTAGVAHAKRNTQNVGVLHPQHLANSRTSSVVAAFHGPKNEWLKELIATVRRHQARTLCVMEALMNSGSWHHLGQLLRCQLLNARAGAHQVAIAVGVVDPGHRRPKLR